jgi:hypothetical protein
MEPMQDSHLLMYLPSASAPRFRTVIFCHIVILPLPLDKVMGQCSNPFVPPHPHSKKWRSNPILLQAQWGLVNVVTLGERRDLRRELRHAGVSIGRARLRQAFRNG